MATVDIIIPLYNKASTVGRTVDSILRQTFSDWNLIIVNDGSTDESLQILDRYSDPRITIINQANQGPGAARNRGIQEAQCEYVAFLDADDEWLPGHLEQSLRAFDQPGIGFVGSMYCEWPRQVDMTRYWLRRNVCQGLFHVNGKESPEQLESWILFFHVGTTTVRTEIARRYEGFYDRDRCCCGEDTIFFAKLVLNETFRIISDVSVKHNRQDSGLSHVPSCAIMPAFECPEIILRFCSDDRKPLARMFLARLALRTAHYRARNGFKETAVLLLKSYPEMRRYRWLYMQLCWEIRLSRWMPLWVKFKSRVGPPSRLFLRTLAYRTGILKPPIEADSVSKMKGL